MPLQKLFIKPILVFFFNSRSPICRPILLWCFGTGSAYYYYVTTFYECYTLLIFYHIFLSRLGGCLTGRPKGKFAAFPSA